MFVVGMWENVEKLKCGYLISRCVLLIRLAVPGCNLLLNLISLQMFSDNFCLSFVIESFFAREIYIPVVLWS